MPIRPLSEEEVQIKARFIQAMYMCIGTRRCKTKSEFAEMVGILPTNVTRLEKNDKISVTVHNVAMLCSKLGVKANWIILGEGEMF